MEIKIFASVAEALGEKGIKLVGINPDSYKWNRQVSVDLNDVGVKRAEELVKLLKPMVYDKGLKIREANGPYKDIQIWLKTMKKGGLEKVKARNCYTFYTLLKPFMKNVVGKRLYYKDVDRGIFLPYYAASASHEPKKVTQYGEREAHTDIRLIYMDFGIIESETCYFNDEDCRGFSVEQILQRDGLYIETEELRNEYLESKARFELISKKIGKQYYATGTATDEVDSDDHDDDNRWRNTKTIYLEKDGQPAQVVVDVFFETDKKEKDNRNASFNPKFWIDDDADEDDDSESEGIEVEIPIHAFLSCFDLRRHMRLKIHESQLKPYKYDHELGNKLVLPKGNRTLIDSLVSANGTFKDVIKGKAGGSVIICTGGPGLGKTLTAEVYSEVVKRPLYSVQCSQLGIEAEEIESNIIKIFRRAKRWRAILLLDEADVYIHKRGKDLQQNAIVGVFLRTLEYYNGVMFLTTNRGNVVDDAILSRCIARVDYHIPTMEDQKKIWKIQAENNGVELSDSQINAIVSKHNNLSGRDIKNLMKLAMMVASSAGKKVTEKTIFSVKQFKPTADLEE